jgi:hypothetical protein
VNIEIVNGQQSDMLHLKIQSPHFTPWVCLELDTEKTNVRGRFFPNGFHLLPNNVQTVSFRRSLRKPKSDHGDEIWKQFLLNAIRIQTLPGMMAAIHQQYEQ